jgi:hypothetical protein
VPHAKPEQHVAVDVLASRRFVQHRPPVTTVEDVHEGDRVFVQSAGLDS